MPAYKRGPTTFDPNSDQPFKISRSKIDTFTECKRCSFLELKYGVKRVQGPTFTLNNAVDALFKNEFDQHRHAGTPHPLMSAHNIEAVPFDHSNMDKWRANFTGVQHLFAEANFLVFGAVDDIWITKTKELIVVDYKATAKKVGPSTVDDLYPAYKKQMEVYQWLLRGNGFDVSATGYFVYANGQAENDKFDNCLHFDVALIPYTGNSDWIEPALLELKEMLMGETIPPVGVAFDGVSPCEYCTYREAAGKQLQAIAKKK